MDTKMFVKTEEEITIMREGCRMLAGVVEQLEPMIVAGASGRDIDAFAEQQIRSLGCEPSFKGYDAGASTPFPATICFSRNHEIVHGIPKDELIEDGDVVKIDIGLIHKGYHADMARTFIVGEGTEQSRALRNAAKGAFEAGLARIRDGATLNDYAGAAQEYAESRDYGVVKNLVGHGIGTELHQAPQIPNYVGQDFPNFTFRAGMTVALEPMINAGNETTKIAEDDWTFVTEDGSLSAHWENTILVTETGTEILTLP